MNCQAKIQSVPWDKATHNCSNVATIKVTIINNNNSKTKCLCSFHRHRYIAKYRYGMKHLNQPCEILETLI